MSGRHTPVISGRLGDDKLSRRVRRKGEPDGGESKVGDEEHRLGTSTA